jgi:hypothetical protein
MSDVVIYDKKSHKFIEKSKRKTKKKTTEEFIADAKALHGDRYDYSLVKYVGVMEKITIICKNHGPFTITPNDHLRAKRKTGCHVCSGVQLNTAGFIEKAIKIHGDKYNYSLANYVNNTTKVIIICKIHDQFLISPSNHYNYGCSICSGFKSNTSEFIKKANLFYGNLYDYSLVNYQKNNIIIEIICGKHGSFKLTPNSHLSGRGCPICSRFKITTESFIDDSINVHGDKYDYSRVKYINNDDKVEIICKIHGSFFQSPYHHLKLQGCKKCSIGNHSKIALKWLSIIEKHLDIQHAGNIGEFKINLKEPSQYWKKHILVDGYNKKYNIVFEFDGILTVDFH